MLRRQNILAIAIAIVIGLGAVFLANAYWGARDKAADAAQAGTVRVAVAAVPLEYGTQISPDKVRFVAYPATSLPPGVFKSLDELTPMGKQRVVLRPILPNQLLLAADLTGEGENASIAALLPDGMRAASVRINDVSGVAGFVKPNDTVDVLITREAIGANRDAQVTDVLLQNVRVIAMDQVAKSENPAAAVARTATLEVTPIDAQKLALGQQLGQLSLTLRKPGAEQNIAYVDTVSLEDLRYDLYGQPRMAPPASGRDLAARLAVPAAAPEPRRAAPRRAAPAPRRIAPAPSTSSVEITRGTTVSKYEVGGYVR
jgi:pilus assembly protein CpaB